ncbi:inhibitor of the pro-sigma K processing machinery [Paenibacillus shirakamiensis]|uniref:Inhibitor of the pro-sigma K processing machinery n=1 Tax=Paenibacillus shirakamiensis TaxID=1265935 RepID=A0ABS4JM01_9BACL|nr:pro-sigmaK processing inhibitor BofA family protein [Paenibacillus shirakamiensis]MBP2002737.1 inhibitor of the pro-sigma K processing machinery [Paenibacillus shirakamiensis]
MRYLLLGVLIIATCLLLYIWISRRLGLAWITRLGLHIVIAGLGLYLVNYSGVFTDTYIPLNPVTMSTVVLLGLPGVALLLGIKLSLI